MISGTTLPSSMTIFDGSFHIDSLSIYDNTIPKRIDNGIRQGLEVKITNRIKDMTELYEILYGSRKIYNKKNVIIYLMIGILVPTVIFLWGLNEKNKTLNPIRSTGEEESVYDTKENIDSDSTIQDKGVEINTETTEYEKDTAKMYIAENNLDYSDTNLLEYVEENDGIIITNSDLSLTEIVIPEEINGLKVKSVRGIGSNAISVVLPDSLQSIEDNAFRNCVYLENIYIPEGVSTIGKGAFDNCLSLKEIHISKDNEVFMLENGIIYDMNGIKYN